MKLNSTENDECDRTSGGGGVGGETMLMSTLNSQRMDETATTRIIRGGGGETSLDGGDDHEEIFFVELNSREMPIDCPEGYVAAVKTRPSIVVSQPAANTQIDPNTTSSTTKNSIIKPLLSILLKGGASKMSLNATSQQNTTKNKSASVSSSTSSSSSSSPHTTIELASMETIERARRHVEVAERPVGAGRGEINSCFVMDSSSSAEEKSSSSLVVVNGNTMNTSDGIGSSSSSSSGGNTPAAQQLLLMSSPSSPSTASSAASLIKSEFINNLNGGGIEMTSNTMYAAVTTSNNPDNPVSMLEFNQNIVIKNVDIGALATSANLTSSPGSAVNANTTTTRPPIADLDLERMLNTNENKAGLHERIVMSKKMIVEKGFKQNIEHNHEKKLENTSEEAKVERSASRSGNNNNKLREEILNNLDYSKIQTSSQSFEHNHPLIERHHRGGSSSHKKSSSSSNNNSSSSSTSSSSCVASSIGKQDDDEKLEEDDLKKNLDNEEDENGYIDERMLTDEGRFLLKKAQYYCVDNLKLVNIEKLDAPLGATIKSADGAILISRIVIGGAAQRSGLLHENDEILEVNSIPVRGKTINDICDMLYNMQGIISFLIIPNMIIDEDGEEEGEKEASVAAAAAAAATASSAAAEKCSLEKKPLEIGLKPNLHLRALFNYSPRDDLYIPCKELGLEFSKGDILHVISQSDQDWWQAYRDESSEKEAANSLARLIPSQIFQERRFSQMKAIIGDSFMTRKKREKGICVRGFQSNRRRLALFGASSDILTYEEVTLYRPPASRKRPIVLIGPHNIGRHELRKRLMQTHPSLFEVAVPHTTRPARRDEIDGKDYHFLPRHIFEADIKQSRFIEHGEYEKNLYGTSREAIKKVIENGKICVLNLYPQALKALRLSDLLPYVIYIGPPNLVKLKELKTKTNETYRENDLLDIIDKGREIEEVYGHYFDKIIRNTDMDRTYKELYETIESVQSQKNWVPTNWLTKS